MIANRTNAEWVAALKGGGPEQAAALADLRTLVLRAALFSLHRSRGGLGLLGRAEVRQLAEDCAQEALLAVLSRVDQFRGESRFTTWVYSFGVNAALIAARRERWRRAPLGRLLDGADPGGWPLAPGTAGADPHRQAVQDETLAAVRHGIEHLLTDRQRRALKAIVFEGVPLDEVARHWNSNRNAVYKLLHDARRKLKAHLAARGLGAGDALGMSGARR